jgi:hypothetical protein
MYMSNQRPSFAKRDREMRLKDRARQKQEARAARAANPSATKGPPIGDPPPSLWDDAATDPKPDDE